MIKKISLVVALLTASVQAINLEADSRFGFKDFVAENINKMAGGEELKDKLQG